MNNKQITEMEKHDLAIQLYNAYNDLKDAASKIPVTYVLSVSMLATLRAIADEGLQVA